MKLIDLQNDITQAVQNHLALDVSDQDARGRDMYIITDIPRLSEKQFDKLWDLSFEAVPPKGYLSIMRYDPDNPELAGVFPELRDFTATYDGIEKIKWKKFVETMQSYYDPWYDNQGDDFDE